MSIAGTQRRRRLSGPHADRLLGVRTQIAWLLVTAPIALVVGCGGQRDGLAPVSGTVTLNGKPVTHGHVFAKPSEGRTAVGRIRPDGTFTLGTDTDSDGAKVGEHTVTLAPPRADEGAPPVDAVVPPAKYNSPRTSGLRMVVPPEGLVDYRIDLSATEDEINASRTPTGFVE